MASRDSVLRYRITAENDQLKRDLAKAKGQLNRFKNQSHGISKQIKAQFAGMFGVFTAGLIARDIFRTVAGFEKRMDKVQAISGATAKEMEKLSTSAVELGRASKFTAGEIAQLQEELARLGFSSDEIIASTDAIRKLATVADAELGESAKSLAGTMNSFNLSAEQSNEVANIMAESFSKSALDLQKFTVAMANVGATARVAGFDMSSTTAMIAQLVNANIDASKAGTDLRKIFTELSKQGLTLEDAFEKINNAQDKNLVAFNLFGQRAATSAVLLAENASKSDLLAQELSDSNKELNEMVGIMEDNLITDLQKLKSAWDGWILSLENGEGVGSSFLRGLSKGFTDLLNGLSDFEGFTRGRGLTYLPGTSPEEQAALKEFQRIVKGITFDGVSVETLEYADAVKTLDKRLEAFKMNKHYESIAAEVEKYKNELKKANEAKAEEASRQKEANKAYSEWLSLRSNSISDRQNVGIQGGPQTADIGPITLSDNSDFLMKYAETMRERQEPFREEMQRQANEINAIINQTIGNALFAAFDGIGRGADIKEIFASILSVIGDGMQQLGGAILGIGVALEALKKSLKSLNGPAAIAAGGALVAAGAALKNAASSFAGNIGGGSGGGGSSGPSGRFQGDLQGQTAFGLPSEIKLVAKGSDLVGVISTTNRQNSRNIAG